MSTCTALETFLNGPREKAAAATFEEHMRGCERCHQQYQRWQRAQPKVVQWVDRQVLVEPDRFRAARLVQRARRHRQESWAPQPQRRWLLSLAAAGALALVLGVGGLAAWRRMADAPGGGRGAVATKAPADLHVRLLEADDAAGAGTSPLLGSVLEPGERGRLLVGIGSARLAAARNSRTTVLQATDVETRVRLLRGRVALDVSGPQRSKRVVIEAGAQTITVLGTRFSVNSLPDEGIEVEVSRGRVAVADAHGQRLELVAGEWLQLHPGEPARRLRVSEEQLAALDALLAPQPPAKPPATAPPSLGPPTRRLDSWRRQVLSGDLEGAEASLVRYLRTAPRDADAWFLLADARRKGQRWNKAVAAYEKVVATGDPAAANQARFLAAVILQEQLGRPGPAGHLLRQYLAQGSRLRPLEETAMLRLARALTAQEKKGEARQVLQDFLQRSGEGESANEARRMMEALGP